MVHEEEVESLTLHLRLEANPSDTKAAVTLLEALNDDKLEEIFESLRLTPAVVSFVGAVLYGCDLCSQTDGVFRRRKRCFNVAIAALTGGYLNQQKARELIEILSCHSRQLYHEQTLSLIGAVIDAGSTAGSNCLTQLLDLLPVLVGDSVDCREYAVEKLYEMNWPRDLILGYTSILVALCASEAECERAMGKIMSYLCGDSNGGERGGQRRRVAATSIDPEELPALVYHLTSIGKKCSSSHLLKNSLLEVIAESLDAMLTEAQGGAAGDVAQQSYVRRMRPIISTVTHHLTMMLMKDQGVADELLSLIKMRRLSTSHSLCFHQSQAGGPYLSSSKLLLALLSSKTPRNEMRTLTALTDFVQEIYSLHPISTVSIWFQPMIWSKVIRVTPQHLCHVFETLLINCSSMQLEGASAPLVNLAFLLMATTNASAVGDIGTIGGMAGGNTGGSLKPGTRDSLLVNTLPFAPPHTGKSNVGADFDITPLTPGTFGAWLLCKIFIHNEHARSQIARELVVRLLVHAQVTATSGSGVIRASSAAGKTQKDQTQAMNSSNGLMPPPATSQTTSGHSENDQGMALLCVSILENLAISCPAGIVEVSSDLQEAFAALPDLTGSTAARLVTVLGGFFNISPGLSDRCTLALRKSGFARDIVHRKAAVCSLLALLRLHLHSAALSEDRGRGQRHLGGASSSSSQYVDEEETYVERDDVPYAMSQQTTEQLMTHSVSSAGLGAFIGISVDETVSMCRRFFSCQKGIRVMLYDLLVQLQLDFPSSRTMVLRLLGSHLNSLVLEDRFDLTWAASTPATPSQQHRVAEKQYIVLNPDKYVDLVSGLPQESLADVLLSTLMLCCPFQKTPNEVLLTNEGSVAANGRQLVNLSQWDRVDMSFVRSGQLRNAKFRSAYEIYLTHDGCSYYTRRVCEDTDSVDVRNTILKLCRGIADASLNELRIPVRIATNAEGGAALGDQYRIFALLEGCHAAMTCCICLPDVTFADSNGLDMSDQRSVRYLAAAASRPRYKLLNFLCMRAEQLTSMAIIIRKNNKQSGLFPTNYNLPHMASPLIRLIQGINTSTIGAVCSTFQKNVHKTGCPTDMHTGLHIFISEYQFIFESLELLNTSEDEEDVVVENPIMKAEPCADRSSSTRPPQPEGVTLGRINEVMTPEMLSFLETHVLERAVVAYECVLTFLTAMGKFDGKIDVSTETAGGGDSSRGDFTGLLWAWWGWFSIRAINNKLFALLLQHFRRIRTREREAVAGGKRGAGISAGSGDKNCVFSNNQLSNLQLVLRSMIGSLRLEISLANLIHRHYSSATKIANIPCQHDDIHLNSGLVLLLENAFDGLSRKRDGSTSYGSMLTQRLGIESTSFTQNASSATYTQDGSSGSDVQWINVLQTHMKNFGKLFLAMHQMEAEKGDAPAIICIMSELFDVLASVPAAQKDSGDQLLRYCKDKLVNPTGYLTRGLLQLAVLHIAPDPADRLRRALQVSLMIQVCVRPLHRGEEVVIDSDEEDDVLFENSRKQSEDGVCVLVSRASAYHGASILIQIVEKACNEVDLLYKLSAKERQRSDKIPEVLYSWTQAAGDRENNSTNSLNELNSIICATLLRVVHIFEKVCHESLAGVSVKLLGVVVKFYKFMVKLTKDITTRANKGIEAVSSCVSPLYRNLCARVVDKLAPKLSDYLLKVRNAEYGEQSDEDDVDNDDNDGSSRRGKGPQNKKKTTVNQRLKKLVPEVIYQLEQLDVMFIKLSGVLKGVEKVIVGKWIKRKAICDFKLKADMIKSEQQKVAHMEQKKQSSRKRKQSNRDSDEEDINENNSSSFRRRHRNDDDTVSAAAYSDVAQEMDIDTRDSDDDRY